MKVKITNLELINILSTLKQFEEKKFPQKLSFAILRVMTILKENYSIYGESVNRILKEYKNYFQYDDKGEIKQDPTGLPVVLEYKRESFKTEINELLSVDFEIEIPTVDSGIFDYEDSDKYDSLSPKEMMILSAILCGQL